MRERSSKSYLTQYEGVPEPVQTGLNLNPIGLMLKRRLQEDGVAFVPALWPDQLTQVSEELAGGKVKVYRNPNERVLRTQRTDLELEDGRVSVERYTFATGLGVFPARPTGIKVAPNEGTPDALVINGNVRGTVKIFSFEDRDGRHFGLATGDNIELALAQALGIEDPEVATKAAGSYVSEDVIRWIKIRFALKFR